MRHPSYHTAVAIPKYGLTGGAEAFAAQLTERLAEDRHYQIHVFANQWVDSRSSVTFHKVPMISFPKFLTTSSFAQFACSKISKRAFDLIHTHDRIFEADLYTMHGIPHRLWVRDVRKKKRMSLFDLNTQWVEKKLVLNRRCRIFHAVSQLTKEKFLQEYPMIDPDRVRVIHPGVDAATFRAHDRLAVRRDIRKSFRLDSTDTVVLFVSMNIDIRGLDHLIKGLARVKIMHPNYRVKLLVVGKGNIKKYRALARSLGILEQIIFTGNTERDMLEKIYSASDFFSILSEFDTFSMTTLEAMAASLPVIINPNMGVKDLIKEGVNGFIIKNTGNIEEIADKIDRMMNESIRFQMAEEAHKTASGQTWSETARKMEALYAELLDRGRNEFRHR